MEASLSITSPLKEHILSQESHYSHDTIARQLENKSTVVKQKRERLENEATSLYRQLSDELQRAVQLAKEKGASTWLTALPLSDHGFTLHKTAFHDALALRYGWTPSNLPQPCDCGNSFTVEHALSCAKGGFPILRHNEIRDLTASLLSEVCGDVCIEPDLQPVPEEALTGSTANKQDNARVDISANGVWGGRHEKTFLDVRVFNPHAPSNKNLPLTTCYHKHEKKKKCGYGLRVREFEHATLTPLILAASSGLGAEATCFYKPLASLLSTKWNCSYSITLCWLPCRLSFSLLCSAIMANRGARTLYRNRSPNSNVYLAIAEAVLEWE